ATRLAHRRRGETFLSKPDGDPCGTVGVRRRPRGTAGTTARHVRQRVHCRRMGRIARSVVGCGGRQRRGGGETRGGDARGGCMKTVEELFAEHRRFLWSLSYRMTGNAADADDVVQDTFVRAIEHPSRRPDDPLRPWLVKVTLNLSRDLLRKRKRRDYVGPW